MFYRNGNTVSANYSSMVGGCGNSDAGFNFAGVFGQGITAVANNTLHVNCLNAAGTPGAIGGLPVGTVFYLGSGSPVPTNSYPLYIQLP